MILLIVFPKQVVLVVLPWSGMLGAKTVKKRILDFRRWKNAKPAAHLEVWSTKCDKQQKKTKKSFPKLKTLITIIFTKVLNWRCLAGFFSRTCQNVFASSKKLRLSFYRILVNLPDTTRMDAMAPRTNCFWNMICQTILKFNYFWGRVQPSFRLFNFISFFTLTSLIYSMLEILLWRVRMSFRPSTLKSYWNFN